jgi:hypothetical protein
MRIGFRPHFLEWFGQELKKTFPREAGRQGIKSDRP